MTSVTNKTKLFICDPLWNNLTTPQQILALQKAGYELYVDTVPKPLKDVPGLFEGDEPRILAINPDFVGWKLKSEDYAGIPNLHGICTESTGFEWIERKVADERNIPICNITNFSTQSVAEWAVLMALSLARQIPRLIKDGFPLDYDKDFMGYRGIELRGKTAGIVGLGNIGTAVAERCQGLGMDVAYWTRSPKDSPYTRLELDELLKTADVIFLTIAKNEETLELFSAEKAALMKPSAILIDIVHGLFDQVLILQMVKDGTLFGFGFEGKPEEFNMHTGNVWAAPAYAWATSESMHNSEAKLIENLIAASKGEFPNRVNTL